MKFGVREICDVTFKAAANGQKVGTKSFKKYQPVFMIDTAKTSNMEQATTTVYANGGRGNSRLVAWEGEKTMTFTVEDALISPMGLAVLSGAGLIKAGTGTDSARVHVTLTKEVKDTGSGSTPTGGKVNITLADLQEETGLTTATKFTICKKIPAYATVIGSSGNVYDFYELDGFGEEADPASVDVTANASADLELKDGDTTKGEKTAADAVGKTVVVDFYLAMTNSVTTVEIGPDDFGGYFYVEAQTLFRDEQTGKDMAAELIFPKVKVQSGFTFTMASSGDPSTFTFTMDAFPGYAICKPEKKTLCDIQIIEGNFDEDDDTITCNCNPSGETPAF